MTNSFWLENSLLVFCLAALITSVLIPRILSIAYTRQLFDEPDERKIHKYTIPRLGGMAFLPAIILSMAFVAGINLKYENMDMARELVACVIPLLFMICALFMLYLTGIADDLVGVRYSVKFIVQIIASALIIASGDFINNLYGFLWLDELPVWLGWMLTAFAVVFIVNAINLIDGIDGLASGLSTIALISFAIAFYEGGHNLYAMMAMAAAGTLLPFFYYNVFGDPKKHKKIFMGDTGSLTTGLLLAALAITIDNLAPITIDGDKYNPVIMAISPLLVPAFDVVRVYLHRVRNNRNPFLPDKSHIHHKLLDLGMSQRKALLLILGVSILFVVSNVILSEFTDPNIIIGGDVLIWTIANILLTKAIRRREKRLGQHLYE